MDNENKYSIQDLDEYILQGEPERREKAIAWQTAIGLQAVDGLTVSDYLIELAIKNIKGELTSQDVNRMINEHYAAKHKKYNTYTRVNHVANPIAAPKGSPIYIN